MKKIGRDTLDELSRQARQSERLRKNLNLHADYDDPCQRLFNAIEPGSYIRPHRHSEPPKPETFVVIRGALILVTFDDHGEIAEQLSLTPDGEMIAVDLPPGTWHTAVALQPGTIFFEAKPGPYQPLSAKDFAPFAPPEASPEGVLYLEQLSARLAASTRGEGADA